MSTQRGKKLRVLFGTFAAVIGAFALAVIMNIVFPAEEPCYFIFFAETCIIPYLSLKAENKAVAKRQISRAAYIALFFAGYILAAASVILAVRFTDIDWDWYVEDPDFLIGLLIWGLILAVIFRDAVALARHIEAEKKAKRRKTKKTTVLFGTFAAVAAACVSASIADIVSENEIYTIIDTFVFFICAGIYLAILVFLPFISLIAENKAVNNKELSRASYLIDYFIGYFFAGSVWTLFIRFEQSNTEFFYPGHEPDDWTGLLLVFLWLGLAAGFIWAVVFRIIAALLYYICGKIWGKLK